MLEYTGERMVPGKADDETFWEHVYRYRFALPFARGRRVLDVACGEGYGSAALLRAGAGAVIGVDRDDATCRHARATYGVDARPGDAEAIPLPDRSVDLVVSFETIEHLGRPERFLGECRRVLAAGGTLVVSTPNRPVYSARGQHNPFHLCEMDEPEFAGLLRQWFPDVRLYYQCPQSASRWSPFALAARTSPWRDVRGYWRARQLFCPWLLERVQDVLKRESVVELIAARGRPGSPLFNPFAVRPRPRWGEVRPRYLVAVARSR